MLRRAFFTRTLGAIAGAVCAPFVGKAKARITNADVDGVVKVYFQAVKRTRNLTGPGVSASDFIGLNEC